MAEADGAGRVTAGPTGVGLGRWVPGIRTLRQYPRRWLPNDLLAGADVAMMTSALLHNGPDHLRPVELGLRDWMDRHGYETVDQLRGQLSQRSVPDPAAFERANYIKTLASRTAPRR